MNRKLRLLLLATLSVSFLTISAQEGMFGYIDFNSTLRLMPEYMEAEINLQKMQSDYREEIERSKREFERQYIEFMLEQDHLSASVVAKRQRELQLLMDNNAAFRDKVQKDIEIKRDELLVPIKKKLLKVVSEVCLEKSLDYVIDTGKGTYLYINESKGVDITEQVFRQLGIDVHEESVTEGNLPVIVQEDKK
jgi:Skp family chaperone for outer membrane proteins